jgi:AhpD family alkylhydroperoxidase
MMALENYAQNSQLSKTIKELIKIRASQLNKCAFCIDMHTEMALELGESDRRIFALSAWTESHLFTEEERVALQLTEELTTLNTHGVSDTTYNNSIATFGETLTAQMIMQIALINTWNRIAISTKMIYK